MRVATNLLSSCCSVSLVEDRRVQDSVALDIAPIHAGAVERQRQRAVAADRDDPAGTADSPNSIDDRARRLGQRVAAQREARGDFVRDGVADEELAMPGRRYRAARIVGIGPGADQRAVADPPRQFASGSAGRGGGGEIATAIPRNRADRAVATRLVIFGKARRLARQSLLQRLPARGGMEII